MATTTAQVAMSMKEFEDVMEAIDRTTHARVAAIKTGSLDWELPTYTLPPSVRGSDPADVPPEAKQVAEAYVGDEKNSVQKNSDDTQSDLKRRASNQMSQEEYVKLLNEEFAEDEVRYHEQHERLKNNLIQMGERFPERRSAIAHLYHNISVFFSGLWGRIYNAIMDMAQKVVEWLNKAEEWFLGCLAEITNWWRNIFG